MTNDMSFLTNNTVLVWLTVSHTLFLVLPALFALTDEWLHEVSNIRFKTHLHHPAYRRYPHYLAH